MASKFTTVKTELWQAVTALSTACLLLLHYAPIDKIRFRKCAPSLWPCSRVVKSHGKDQYEASIPHTSHHRADCQPQSQIFADHEIRSHGSLETGNFKGDRSWISVNLPAIHENLDNLNKKFEAFKNALANMFTVVDENDIGLYKQHLENWTHYYGWVKMIMENVLNNSDEESVSVSNDSGYASEISGSTETSHLEHGTSYQTESLHSEESGTDISSVNGGVDSYPTGIICVDQPIQSARYMSSDIEREIQEINHSVVELKGAGSSYTPIYLDKLKRRCEELKKRIKVDQNQTFGNLKKQFIEEGSVMFKTYTDAMDNYMEQVNNVQIEIGIIERLNFTYSKGEQDISSYLEPLKSPVFSGELEDWLEFSTHWNNLFKDVPENIALCHLKACIPEADVKRVAGVRSLKEVWDRLNLWYGNTDIQVHIIKLKLEGLVPKSELPHEQVIEVYETVQNANTLLENCNAMSYLDEDFSIINSLVMKLSYEDQWNYSEYITTVSADSELSSRWSKFSKWLKQKYNAALHRRVMHMCVNTGTREKPDHISKDNLFKKSDRNSLENREGPRENIEDVRGHALPITQNKSDYATQFIQAKQCVGNCPVCGLEAHFYKRKFLFGLANWPSDRLHSCSKFHKMTLDERIDILNRVGGCLKCSSWTHAQDSCNTRSKSTCPVIVSGVTCGERHHKLFHVPKVGKSKDEIINKTYDEGELDIAGYHTMRPLAGGVLDLADSQISSMNISDLSQEERDMTFFSKQSIFSKMEVCMNEVAEQITRKPVYQNLIENDNVKNQGDQCGIAHGCSPAQGNKELCTQIDDSINLYLKSYITNLNSSMESIREQNSKFIQAIDNVCISVVKGNHGDNCVINNAQLLSFRAETFTGWDCSIDSKKQNNVPRLQASPPKISRHRFNKSLSRYLARKIPTTGKVKRYEDVFVNSEIDVCDTAPLSHEEKQVAVLQLNKMDDSFLRTNLELESQNLANMDYIKRIKWLNKSDPNGQDDMSGVKQESSLNSSGVVSTEVMSGICTAESNFMPSVGFKEYIECCTFALLAHCGIVRADEHFLKYLLQINCENNLRRYCNCKILLDIINSIQPCSRTSNRSLNMCPTDSSISRSFSSEIIFTGDSEQLSDIAVEETKSQNLRISVLHKLKPSFIQLVPEEYVKYINGDTLTVDNIYIFKTKDLLKRLEELVSITNSLDEISIVICLMKFKSLSNVSLFSLPRNSPQIMWLCETPQLFEVHSELALSLKHSVMADLESSSRVAVVGYASIHSLDEEDPHLMYTLEIALKFNKGMVYISLNSSSGNNTTCKAVRIMEPKLVTYGKNAVNLQPIQHNIMVHMMVGCTGVDALFRGSHDVSQFLLMSGGAVINVGEYIHLDSKVARGLTARLLCSITIRSDIIKHDYELEFLLSTLATYWSAYQSQLVTVILSDRILVLQLLDTEQLLSLVNPTDRESSLTYRLGFIGSSSLRSLNIFIMEVELVVSQLAIESDDKCEMGPVETLYIGQTLPFVKPCIGDVKDTTLTDVFSGGYFVEYMGKPTSGHYVTTADTLHSFMYSVNKPSDVQKGQYCSAIKLSSSYIGLKTLDKVSGTVFDKLLTKQLDLGAEKYVTCLNKTKFYGEDHVKFVSKSRFQRDHYSDGFASEYRYLSIGSSWQLSLQLFVLFVGM